MDRVSCSAQITPPQIDGGTLLGISRPFSCVQQYGCVGTVAGPDAAFGYRFGAVKLMQNRRALIVHALVGWRRSLARFQMRIDANIVTGA